MQLVEAPAVGARVLDWLRSNGVVADLPSDNTEMLAAIESKGLPLPSVAARAPGERARLATRAGLRRKDGTNAVYYESGAIEDPVINRRLVDVLEGTKPAFTRRAAKYLLG